MCQPWEQLLDHRDNRVLERTKIAGVIDLEKLRSKLGHADLDRTLPGAGLAGEAIVHGAPDIMREVLSV